MESLTVRSSRREELIDVTAKVQDAVRKWGLENGAVLVFCPHTTGAVTINENADPDVARDIITHLNRFIPRLGDYRHAEGNSDAHIKSSLVGASELVIVKDGRLLLGTWQGIYFCEFDGPRTRTLHIQTLQGTARHGS